MLKIHRKKIKLKYLVTGTGRCGTVFMARLLTSLGEMCGHEAIFSHGGKDMAINRIQQMSLKTSLCSHGDWFDATKVTAESSYMAAPFLDSQIFNETKIIHVIRNPLDVINSHILDVRFFEYFNEEQRPWQEFVLNHMPELLKIQNITERACYYYINWNKLIEIKSSGRPYFLHRVEKKLSPELMDFLEISNPDPAIFFEEKINSWKKETLLSPFISQFFRKEKRLKLTDIPDGSIKDEFTTMAKKYGYFL